MTWFADLTPYDGALRIGWLQREHAFPAGDVPAAFVARLELLLAHATTRLTEGQHHCDRCPQTGSWGNAEIRALGADGTRYVAPSLIAHYVTVHRYAPPQGFVDAVLRVSLGKDDAFARDLCLACGNAMTRTREETAYRGWPWCDEGLCVDFDCATCGTSYSRSFPA